MSAALQKGASWTIEEDADAGEVRVVLAGRLSEYADLESLSASIPATKRLRIDLAGIERINSLGARLWLGFAEVCRARFEEIKLERCSVVFVSQVNTVAGFATNREVESVYAPYVCETCGAERDTLVDATASNLVLPEVNCEDDGSPMVFDDMEEVYFAFLRRA